MFFASRSEKKGERKSKTVFDVTEIEDSAKPKVILRKQTKN